MLLSLLAQGTLVVAGMGAPDRVQVPAGLERGLFGLDTPVLAPELLARAAALAAGEWTAEARTEWLPGPDGFEPVERLWLTRGTTALNVQLVRRGLALAHVRSREPRGVEALAAAARAAQRDGAGLWAPRARPPHGPPAPVAGVALPLHLKDPGLGYETELEELRALGARWVSLLVITRQERADSSAVPLVSDRAPPAALVGRTIERARELGLSVLLMPVVLIRAPGPDDWRGVLAPADLHRWFLSYDRFIAHWADVAAASGASALAVGSELCSLEQHTAAWRRVVANARMRFPGWLSYSANWDHFERIEFWPALDFAGVSAYFDLSYEDAPRPAGLRDGWRRGRAEIERLHALSGLPVVLTEVGVPSVRGAHTGPWDYTRTGPPDPAGQALCFATFRDVFTPLSGPPPPGFHGLFLYDWWGAGGLDDRRYTARGKPAAAIWRTILLRVAARGPARVR